MSGSKPPILVFGATGQQGGSVADTLLKAGEPVRVLVRNPASQKAAALAARGAELVQGDLSDPASMREAMTGARGVFSVQPSSTTGTLSDEDEVRYGISVADLAVQSGVGQLVYSSVSAVGNNPTGMGHFDSKARIEAHILTLPMTWTIVRPVTFMDMLVMPGFGLDEDRFTFFTARNQHMQLLAVEDIGRFVAPIFADPARFAGQTFEIASDIVTGAKIEAAFSKAAGRSIAYSRFPDAVLAANPFLGGLTALLDSGPLAGHADLEVMRQINPRIQSFDTWLAGSGREPFEAALDTPGSWDYDDASP